MKNESGFWHNHGMEEGGAPRVLLDLLGGLDRDRVLPDAGGGPRPGGTELLPEGAAATDRDTEIAGLRGPSPRRATFSASSDLSA